MTLRSFILLFFLGYAGSLTARTSITPPKNNCDTVYTHDGRTLVVRNWTIRGEEMEYFLCEQVDNWPKGRLPLSNVKEIRCSPRPNQERAYKVWALLHDNPSPVIGYLLMTTDSSILLSQKPDGVKPGDVVELPVSRINKIKLSPRGRLGRSVAAGAGIGVGTGLILGYASGDDQEGFLVFSKEEKALFGAIFLGITGAVIGLFVGLKKKIMYLNGSTEKYRFFRPLLNKYALKGK